MSRTMKSLTGLKKRSLLRYEYGMGLVEVIWYGCDIHMVWGHYNVVWHDFTDMILLFNTVWPVAMCCSYNKVTKVCTCNTFQNGRGVATWGNLKKSVICAHKSSSWTQV